MTKRVEYNADSEAEQRKRGTVTIGNVEFHPVKRNHRVMRQLIELTPEDDPDRFEMIDGKRVEKPMSKEESIASLDILYDQLGILLRDAEDNPPAREMLLEELDLEDAREIVQSLSPSQAQQAGESQGGESS